MAQLQLVIVTPEITTLDKLVDGVIVPLIDGEAGIFPGHAPMIGRLGPGELRVQDGAKGERFYVDGGFVQVDKNVVSVLTDRSIPASKIDLVAAKAALEAAEREPSNNTELAAIREKALARARAQINMAQRS